MAEIIKRGFSVLELLIVSGAIYILVHISINSIRSLERVVYRGTINGHAVEYREGYYTGNRMFLRVGSKQYGLEDTVGYTPISQPLQQGYLENIVISDGQNKEEYSVHREEGKEVYTMTLDKNATGKNPKAVFDEANKVYNDIRLKIQEEMKTDNSPGKKVWGCA